MIHTSIDSFGGGFVVRLLSTGTGTGKVVIPQYDLSRNNIKGDAVKSVKAYNYGGTASLLINATNDRVIYGAMQGGIQPLYIGRGDVEIIAFWASPNEKTFVFYYNDIAGYIFDLVP